MEMERRKRKTFFAVHWGKLRARVDFYSSVLIHFDGPNNRSLMSITSGLSARIRPRRTCFHWRWVWLSFYISSFFCLVYKSKQNPCYGKS